MNSEPAALIAGPEDESLMNIFEKNWRLSRKAVTSVFAAAFFFVFFVGCSRPEKVVTGCELDSDCGNALHFRCETATGTCLCRTDDACGGLTCNSAGYCQASSGCFGIADCPDGFFCDTSENICLPKGRCAIDLHCPHGQVCDALSYPCREGCRSHGDCLFGAACGCGEDTNCVCDTLDEKERLSCQIGSCDSSRCISREYCRYGEECISSDDGRTSSCQSDYDVSKRPYCDACTSGVAGALACGDGPNFCLYSTYTGTTFCGADCSSGQTCPNGFTCNDVIVVWMRTLCSDASDCRKPENISAVPCSSSDDCPNSALCDTESGFCYGACIRHEGSSQSFCACVEDDDCVQDSCDPVTRTCTTTRQPCDPALDNCPKIRCVDFGNKGGCLIGKNCAPEEGLTCEDMNISR